MASPYRISFTLNTSADIVTIAGTAGTVVTVVTSDIKRNKVRDLEKDI